MASRTGPSRTNQATRLSAPNPWDRHPRHVSTADTRAHPRQTRRGAGRAWARQSPQNQSPLAPHPPQRGGKRKSSTPSARITPLLQDYPTRWPALLQRHHRPDHAAIGKRPRRQLHHRPGAKNDRADAPGLELEHHLFDPPLPVKEEHVDREAHEEHVDRVAGFDPEAPPPLQAWPAHET